VDQPLEHPVVGLIGVGRPAALRGHDLDLDYMKKFLLIAAVASVLLYAALSAFFDLIQKATQ
jgi:hypothetical protein